MIKKALAVSTVFLFLSFGVSLSAANLKADKKEIGRTEKSVIYDNGNGTHTREISPFKRNFKGSDGKFREIRTDIADNGAGRFGVADNPLEVSFPKISGDNDSVDMGTGVLSLSWKLKTISLVSADGSHPVILVKNRKSGTAEKNKIKYEGLFENIADSYTVAPGRIKNDMILKKLPQLPKNKTAQYLKITGEYLLPQGGRVFIDGAEINSKTETEKGFEIRTAGADGYTVDPVLVYENYNDTQYLPAASPDDAKISGKYILEAKNGKLFVSILVDYAWLAQADRKFPVNIDPAIWLKSYRVDYFSSTNDAMIGTIYANNYGANTYGWVANNPSTANIMRILLDFNEVDAFSNTLPISSATLSLYRDAFLIGANGYGDIEVHELTRAFTEGTGTDGSPTTNGATWLKYNATLSWTTPGGDFNPEIISQAKSFAGGLVGFMDFDITSIFNKWVKNLPASPNGIILKLSGAQENSNVPFGMRFLLYDSAANWPMVRVTYFTGSDKRLYAKSKALTVSSFPAYQFTNFFYPHTWTTAPLLDSYDLLVGTDSTKNGPFRGYIQFDLSYLPRNLSVTASSVMVYAYASLGNGANIVDMYRITQPWDANGASWVSRTADTAWSTAGGDYDGALLSSVSIPKNPAAYFPFNLPPSVCEGWIEGSVPNNGVMLKAQSEGAGLFGTYIMNFDINSLSPNVTGDPYKFMPVLNITFTAEAGFTPPELLLPLGNEIADKQLVVQWRWGSQSSLPDPLNLTYQAEYSDNGGGSWNALTTTLAKVNYFVWDTSALTASGNYLVRVRAYDGTTYSSYSTCAQPFMVSHAPSELQILSAFASPVSVQSGEDVTLIVNAANTNWREAARVGVNNFTAATFAGSASGAQLTANTFEIIPPLGRADFTWTFKTTGSGTVNFTGNLRALMGDGPPIGQFNSFDSNMAVISGPVISTNVDVLASTPSETMTYTLTPTITPTYSFTPTAVTGAGGTWYLSTASAPYGARYGHAMADYNGYMWIISGIGDSVYKKDVWRGTDGVDWELVTGNAAFPGRFRNRAVVHDDGTGKKIFMMGGFDGTNALTDVWKSSDGINWELATANPGWYKREHMGVVSYNGYIYVIGGDDGTTAMSDVWRSANGVDWEFLTTGAPFGLRTNTEAVVFDDGGGKKIFILGGSTTTAVTTAVNSVYSSTDGINWTMRGSMPVNRAIHRALVYKNKIYVIAGHDGTAYRGDVISTINGDAWVSETGTAFSARNNFGAVVYSEKMWVTGGYNAAGMTDCRYSPQLPTPTYTPSITATPTRTNTATYTMTATPTFTRTVTASVTQTTTPTITHTNSPTLSFTATLTQTVSPTEIATVCLCEKELGNTVVGSLSADFSGRIHTNKYSFYSGTDAYATGIMVYVAATNGTAKMRAAIYSAAGMNHGVPRAQSGEITPVTGWNYLDIPDNFINSVSFPQGVLLAMNIEPGLEIAYDDTALPPSEHQISLAPEPYGIFGTLSTDLNGGNTRKYSAYIIYCPVDCNITPTNTPSPTQSPVYSPTATATIMPTMACAPQGNSNIGAFTDSTVPYSNIRASRYYLDAGTVQQLSVYVSAGAGGNISAAIYSDNANAPDAVLAHSAVKAMVNGWNTVNVNYDVLVAGYYWLAFQPSVSGVTFRYDLSGAVLNSANAANAAGAFPVWPASWGVSNPSTRHWSIYAQLCEAHTSTVTQTAIETVTQTITPSVTQTVTQTITQSKTPTGTQTVTDTVTQTITQTVTETVTATTTRTVTQTVTQTMTGTATPTVTQTATQTVTRTVTETVTQTITETVTPTVTMTVTDTVSSNTPTSTQTFTVSPTITQSVTRTVTQTITLTITETSSVTATATYTSTPTFTWTLTSTMTPTRTSSATDTPTYTMTNTAAETSTDTPTNTASPTATNTYTVTPTFTATKTNTPVDTQTNTPTITFTVTPTNTYTVTLTLTVSATHTVSPTFTSTPTPDIAAQFDKNYFNPGGGETLQIGTRANANTRVCIKAYNLNGEMVRKHEYTTAVSGWNIVAWDGKNDAGKILGRGIYFIHVQKEGGKSEVKRVYIFK